MMDFESVADELYGVAREKFTALRDERVRQARASGDRALATRIKGLRKPTAAAWLVNQLARRFEAELRRLDELGAALRQAHGAVAGDELRALSKQRHQLVQELTERAQWLGRKAGQRPSDAVTTQLQDTFEAALADPEAAARLRAGRLLTALEPAGSEQWLAAALAAGPSAKPGKSGKGRDKGKSEKAATTKAATTTSGGRKNAGRQDTGKSAGRKKSDASAAQQRRQDELRQVREAVAAADEQRAQARQELSEAEHVASELARRISDLREQLDEAERVERDARKEVAAARRRVRQTERAAELAEKALANRG